MRAPVIAQIEAYGAFCAELGEEPAVVALAWLSRTVRCRGWDLRGSWGWKGVLGLAGLSASVAGGADETSGATGPGRSG